MSLTENSDETLFRETTERFWLLRLVSEVRESGIYVRWNRSNARFVEFEQTQLKK